MRSKPMIWLFFIMILILTGCGVFSSGDEEQSSDPLLSAEVFESLPTITPTFPPPTATPAIPATPEPQIGKAGPGEVIFVRDGQIVAIHPDGSNERTLTLFTGTPIIRDLTASSDGRYAAFSINSQELMIYDLIAGQITTVDQVVGGTFGPFAWSPDDATLFYGKLIVDAETSEPSSQIWQVETTTNLPSVALESANDGGEIIPLYALANGSLVYTELTGDGDGINEVFVALPGTGEAGRSPLSESYGLWDISPDGGRLLLLDYATVSSTSQLDPVPLYIANFWAANDGFEALLASPSDDPGVYLNARFAPDNQRIIAFYYTPSLEGESLVSRPVSLVLLRPTDDGGFQKIVLAPSDDYMVLDFSWHSEIGVIAQRLSLTTNAFELWLLPLDGSPGTLITVGEQPVVLGGR